MIYIWCRNDIDLTTYRNRYFELHIETVICFNIWRVFEEQIHRKINGKQFAEEICQDKSNSNEQKCQGYVNRIINNNNIIEIKPYLLR